MKLAVYLFLATLALISSSCVRIETKVAAAVRECESSIDERLRNHFERFEERPTQIINNTEGISVRSRATNIRLGDHKIEWIETVDKKGVRAAEIKVNGDLIKFNGLESINNIDEDSKIEVNWVNSWHQIRLYKLGDRDLITVEMIQQGCTGIGCGVSVQLIYDLKTKTKSFFGTYRTDSQARLFRFTSEVEYFFVSKSFTGDPHGVTRPAVVTYELYALRPNGQFQLQKTPGGNRYFIKHTVFPDREFEGDTVKQKKQLIPDTLEQNWIKPVE